MKWISALLLIANVAIYLWASGHQVTVDEITSASKTDVNIEGMLLLSETSASKQIGTIEAAEVIEAGLSSEIGIFNKASEAEDDIEGASEVVDEVTIIADEETIEDQPQQIEQTTGESTDQAEETDDVVSDQDQIIEEVEEQQTEAALSLVQFCFRVGPFKKENSWLSANEWMAQNGISFQHVTSESRELRAVRVYLGPYDSISDTSSTVDQLKGKNLDHFVYLVENGLARISLGYFTQEELAAKFLEYLNTIDVDAQSQLEYRQLGPFNWMEIPVGNVESGQLSNHDWIEESVGLTQVDC